MSGLEARRNEPKRQLEQMIRRYAASCGVSLALAWQDFDRAYDTAYRTNLIILRRKYCERAGLAHISRPAYFELTGDLNDALRIAGKLTDQTGRESKVQSLKVQSSLKRFEH